MPPAIELLSSEHAPRRCEPILRSIPEWFGIEEATRMYIDATARLPTWAALLDGADAGFITLAQHFPAAAEVYCIAVARPFHGRGVGTALLHHAEGHLLARGVRFLQVKTLGPSRPCEHYALTLRFYESRGFVRLEEFPNLWPGNPCLLLVKTL